MLWPTAPFQGQAGVRSQLHAKEILSTFPSVKAEAVKECGTILPHHSSFLTIFPREQTQTHPSKKHWNHFCLLVFKKYFPPTPVLINGNNSFAKKTLLSEHWLCFE